VGDDWMVDAGGHRYLMGIEKWQLVVVVGLVSLIAVTREIVVDVDVVVVVAAAAAVALLVVVRAIVASAAAAAAAPCLFLFFSLCGAGGGPLLCLSFCIL
jgi:hypothetical protein